MILLAIAATARLVIDGAGLAMIVAGDASPSAEVRRITLSGSSSSTRISANQIGELKVRGSVRLTVGSAIANGATIFVAGSAWVETSPEQESLTVRVDDSGTVNLDHCQLKRLRVVLVGGGCVKASGHVDELRVEGSDSASLEGRDLKVGKADIELDGSGTVALGETNSIDAKLSSTGGVTARNWIILKQKRTGIGRVRHG